jgi:hypothetical protein
MFAARAQTPGGVNNANYTWAAWLTPDSYSNGTWTNLITSTGTVGNFTAPETAPAKVNSGYNFHPSVQFLDASNNAVNRLISANNYVIANNDNVTVILVMKRQGNTNTYDYLLSFNNGGTTNRQLLWNGSNFRLNWPTTANRNFPTFSEGIFAFDNSNNNTDDGIASYINGLKSTQASGAAGNNGTDNKLIIGSGRLTSYNGFEGTIQEMIVLRGGGANNHVNADDFQKIHSYLAVKYGITLNNTENYVNSAGTAVWDRSANTPYNTKIFGIGRDDASGLYQKQSESVAGSAFAVFVGNALQTLNSQNSSGTLNNGEYVMFGTDGTSGTVGYPYDNGYGGFYNGQVVTAPNGLSYRQGSVYKAQLTGTQQITVKLAMRGLIPSYCLVSKDAGFTPANTVIYPVFSNGIVSIELTDEFKYIDFAGYRVTGAGPGGVNNNLKLWLRADDVASLTTVPLPVTDSKLLNYPDANTGTVNALSEWKDIDRNHTYSYADGGSASGHLIPVYQQSNYMTNYHPTVRFWGNSGSSAAWLGNSTTKIWDTQYPVSGKHAVFLLTNNDFGTNAWVYALFFGSAAYVNGNYNGPGYGVEQRTTTGRPVVGRYRTAGTQANGEVNLFKPGATSILAFFPNHPGLTGGSVKFRFNGLEEERTGVSRTGFGLDQPSMVGSSSFNEDRVLQGVMSEVIMYDDEVSASDIQKIESYMAIKYGITLTPDNTASKRFDYVFSDGQVFWNGDVASGNKWATYYNRIAAVIRDDAANLNNRQSHSTNVGSIVHMGVAGKKLGSAAELGDLQYDTEAIVWGDDNAAGTQNIPNPATCGNIESIFNRKWLVHKQTEGDRPLTMLVGAQNNASNQLGIDAGSTDLFDKLSANYNVSMIVADSPEALDPSHASYGDFRAVVPMQFIDGEQQCSYTFTEKETYITFGFKINNTTCETEVEFEGKKTFPWTQWTRQTSTTLTKGAFDLGDGVVVTSTTVAYDPTITVPSNYPSVTNSPTSGSLHIQRRRGNPNRSVTVTIDFNTPVIPEFSISDIDGYSGVFEQVTITGSCDGGGVIPNLSYAGDQSCYQINGNSATSIRRSNIALTNKNGRLDVSFPKGVKQVVIDYVLINAGTLPLVNFDLVISPISIRQIPPPPPLNEDGLSFVKEVKEHNVTTCERVDYSFYITNVNCDDKRVNFTDILPAGMKWEDGVGLGTIDVSTQFNAYAGTNTLQIDSLLVPCSSTLRVSATAIFDENAVPVNQTKSFENRATLNYVQTVENIPIPRTLNSLDRETLDDNTVFNATWAERQDVVQLAATSSTTRYRAGQLLFVSLEIDNPNDPITDMYLDLSFDAGFQFDVVYGISTTNSATATVVTGSLSTDPFRTIAGNAAGTVGFTLPSGTTTLTFRLIAPAANSLVMGLDLDGDPLETIAALNFDYAFSTEMDNPCVIESLNDLSGNLLVPYNTGQSHIIVNKHITVRPAR